MTNMVSPSPSGRRIDIRHILSNTLPPQDHVLQERLASSVGMLAWSGCEGKTMFESQMASGEHSKRQVMSSARALNYSSKKRVD